MVIQIDNKIFLVKLAQGFASFLCSKSTQVTRTANQDNVLIDLVQLTKDTLMLSSHHRYALSEEKAKQFDRLRSSLARLSFRAAAIFSPVAELTVGMSS